jgi:serine/threonine protein kinase
MRICPGCLTRTESDICPKDGYRTVEEKFIKSREQDPLIGQVFDKRYRITELIGHGGMGSVYKALNVAMNQTVALKVMNRELVEDITQVKRFHQEAMASSRLTHPHTIKVFDFGQSEDGLLFIAMEYLDGKPVTRVMKEEGKQPWKRVEKIAFQVGQSLAEAHEKGIVHRDLKPDNIFLIDVIGEPDFVKVLDFGIAKFLSSGTGQVNLTKTGIIVGTPRYMSPEQARGEQLDFRSDLYSLGIIIYEMITGTPPFLGDTPMAVLMAHITQPPPKITQGLISMAVEHLILKLISKNREDRPSSTRDFLNLLQSVSTSQMHMPSFQISAREPEAKMQDEELPGTMILDSSPSMKNIETEKEKYLKKKEAKPDAATVYLPETISGEARLREAVSKSGERGETLYDFTEEAEISGASPLKKIGIIAGILLVGIAVLLILKPWEEKKDQSAEGTVSTGVVSGTDESVNTEEISEPSQQISSVSDIAEANDIITPSIVKVMIESNPSGADAYKDEKFIGKTPFALESDKDEMTIVFRKDGYAEKTLQTTIAEGVSVSVSL